MEGGRPRTRPSRHLEEEGTPSTGRWTLGVQGGEVAPPPRGRRGAPLTTGLPPPIPPAICAASPLVCDNAGSLACRGSGGCGSEGTPLPQTPELQSDQGPSAAPTLVPSQDGPDRGPEAQVPAASAPLPLPLPTPPPSGPSPRPRGRRAEPGPEGGNAGPAAAGKAGCPHPPPPRMGTGVPALWSPAWCGRGSWLRGQAGSAPSLSHDTPRTCLEHVCDTQRGTAEERGHPRWATESGHSHIND